MGQGYARYVALLGLIAIAAFTVHVALTPHRGMTAIRPGVRVPPFAAPYAIGGPPGEVDIAPRARDGLAGRVAACEERGAAILNICQLYERSPVVLALYFDAGSCTRVLSEMNTLASAFPQVEFAAVAVKEEPAEVARLVRSKRISFPVGVDREGRLGGLYAMVSCPQLAFLYPGGIVQSPALLGTPSIAVLRKRVAELLAASLAHGWEGVSRPRKTGRA